MREVRTESYRRGAAWIRALCGALVGAGAGVFIYDVALSIPAMRDSAKVSVDSRELLALVVATALAGCVLTAWRG